MNTAFSILLLFQFCIVAQAAPKFSDKFPEELKEKLLIDFSFANSIKGNAASKLHQQIFGPGPIDGNLYLQYIDKYVKRLDYFPPKFKKDSTGNLMPLDEALLSGGMGRLVARNKYFKLREQMHPFYRLTLLVHEARHSDDRKRSDHVYCPYPYRDLNGQKLVTYYEKLPLEGNDICDREYDSPYALQVIILKNIENFCTTCDAETKSECGKLADNLLLRIVDRDARKILMEDLYIASQDDSRILNTTFPNGKGVQWDGY